MKIIKTLLLLIAMTIAGIPANAEVMKKKKRPYILTAVILTALILVFNLAGMNRSFCDFYTDNIYHFIADGLGFITAPIPFPLGETLMYAGAVTVIVFEAA